MDPRLFDNLTRALASRLTRRGAIASVAVAAVAPLARVEMAEAARRGPGRSCSQDGHCVEGAICAGSGRRKTCVCVSEPCCNDASECEVGALTAEVACREGVCVDVNCVGNAVVCDGACVDVSGNDPQNCGACGRAVDTDRGEACCQGEVCAYGELCIYQPAPTGTITITGPIPTAAPITSICGVGIP
jgi:hypothetical protein